RGLMAFDEIRLVAAALDQVDELFSIHSGQHRRPRDLIAVQMQNRNHRAVARGIQKLVGVPARGESAGLGLAVADHATDERIGIVKHGAVGMQQRISELTAFVDGSWRFRSRVTGYPSRKRKLTEQ